jgi:hypothetical protein
LSGPDARGDAFSVVCRASIGGRVVENVLGGDVMMRVEFAEGDRGVAVFENLTFKETSKQATSGLPIELVFVCAERGILHPSVSVKYPTPFLSVAKKSKTK